VGRIEGEKLMAEYTTNYNLEKQQNNDYISIEGINDNFDTIDTELKNLNDKKVATETGKGLSANDYTTTEKTKLASIAENANNYTHPTSGVTAGTYRNVTVNAQGHVTTGTNPTLAISEGGTGATTAESARNNLGLGGTTGALEIAHGGTGATTAAAALTNLGAAALSGATFTGNVVCSQNITTPNSSSYGVKVGYDAYICDINRSHMLCVASQTTPTTNGGIVFSTANDTYIQRIAAGAVEVSTNTSYSTAQLRNIQASTTDITAGSSSLTSGIIYIVYE
jgi:hypothetical protein